VQSRTRSERFNQGREDIVTDSINNVGFSNTVKIWTDEAGGVSVDSFLRARYGVYPFYFDAGDGVTVNTQKFICPTWQRVVKGANFVEITLTLIQVFDPSAPAGVTVPAAAYTVDTISDLRNLTAVQAAAYPRVYVRGYWAAGDGGGGAVDWASASTATHDGFLTYSLLAGGTGRYLRVPETVYSVKQAGAKGDFVADESIYFQAAQDALTALPNGGELYVPAGKYKITNPVYLRSNVQMYGAGTATYINNTNTPATSGYQTAVVFFMGNMAGADFDLLTPYSFTGAIGDRTITLSTANAANFTAGKACVLKGAKRFYQDSSYYNTNLSPTTKNIRTIAIDGYINLVESVNYGTGVVTLRHPLQVAFTSGSTVRCEGVFTSGSTDEVGQAKYIWKNGSIANMRIESLGPWTMRGGMFECLLEDLFIKARHLIYGNGFSHSTIKNLKGLFHQKCMEVAIFTHDNFIKWIDCAWSGQFGDLNSLATEPGGPKGSVFQMGEGAHHNTIEDVSINAGNLSIGVSEIAWFLGFVAGGCHDNKWARVRIQDNGTPDSLLRMQGDSLRDGANDILSYNGRSSFAGTYNTGSQTITAITSTSINYLANGQTITGTGIPPLATITGVNVGALTITISAFPTKNVTAGTLSTMPTIDVPVDSNEFVDCEFYSSGTFTLYTGLSEKDGTGTQVTNNKIRRTKFRGVPIGGATGNNLIIQGSGNILDDVSIDSGNILIATGIAGNTVQNCTLPGQIVGSLGNAPDTSNMFFNNQVGGNKTAAYKLLRQVGYRSRGLNTVPSANTTANTPLQDGSVNLIRTVPANGFIVSSVVKFSIMGFIAGATGATKSIRLVHIEGQSSPVTTEIFLLTVATNLTGEIIIEGEIRCMGTGGGAGQLRAFGLIKAPSQDIPFSKQLTGLSLETYSQSFGVQSWFSASDSSNMAFWKVEFNAIVPEY
jgi:phage-related protein